MVTRTGRLPRTPRTREYPSSDAVGLTALRLRREGSITSIGPMNEPIVDLEKIRLKEQNIIMQGKLAEQEGIDAEQKIIDDQKKLRERVLPDGEGEEPEEPRPSIIESLPERIPEPPKIEELPARIGAGIASVKAPMLAGVAGLKKKIKSVRKSDEYEALKKKWSGSNIKKLADV
jgi:hypothetical protein